MGTQREVDPASLALDSDNPRFAAHGGQHKENEIIRCLADEADLGELLQSIAANGYLDFEQPVVTRTDAGLTVIEGNRRVAAIKLFRKPELAAKLKIPLPPITKDHVGTLNKVRVVEVDSREDARQYIGFKHINGPHKWDAFAKARFAADWYRAERASGTTISDIAQRLGDRHDTILRLVNGVLLLDQAIRLKKFDINDRAPHRPFFFSHLYTALARPQYREYLGLKPEWRKVEPDPDPVPSSHHGHVEKLLGWMYGSAEDGLDPLVTSQNPHVKQLGEVLTNPAALKRLENTRDLAKAHADVTSRGKKFEESLLKAVKHAEDAQQHLDAYDGDKALLTFGDQLVAIGRILVQTMKQSET